MRKTSLWVASSLFLVTTVFAQQSTQIPAPKLPPNAVGPQLVAWSELQKPKPLPPPERADQSPSDEPQTQSQPQQPSIQAFTGTIVKESGSYVLKVSANVVYQIDDQEKARNYEGKQVRISGSLDAKTSMLHVTSIELLA